MSLAKLRCSAIFSPAKLADHRHGLLVLPAGKGLPKDLPFLELWQAILKRKDLKAADLAKTPLVADRPDGGRLALVMVDGAKPRFDRLTVLRKAITPLLDETPAELAVVSFDPDPDTVRDAVYVAWVNGAPMPAQKKKAPRGLKELVVYSVLQGADFNAVAALAKANVMCRELTALPPNVLTPKTYRQRIRAMAKAAGWGVEEFDLRRLRKMGAGAFCAVAQGSDHDDAAIVHLSWRPKQARQKIALVGKGICFDTGGHNLKPARYMTGMHEDMNGSAVALALFQAIVELKLPVEIDAWLAIAHNHLSPGAYTQNDIVKVLDGTTIEIVHTDAEGRMVLADTLTLAARQKPDLLVDFATLTGSMHAALGARYSGVFASEDALALAAAAAGRASGERICLFPMDEDYEAALDSKVADIKQCTMEGEADHILAARFLRRFTDARPWLHVDLSASTCSGGLGAVATDLTGFGVAWGLRLVSDWLGEGR